MVEPIDYSHIYRVRLTIVDRPVDDIGDIKRSLRIATHRGLKSGFDHLERDVCKRCQANETEL